jgi:uncharacterized membrane protein
VDYESYIKRWTAAGLLDEVSAARIVEWEAVQERSSRSFRWPTILALVFGVILLAAGVLLFVNAHWDQLSSSERLSLVVLMVAGFHVAGALMAARFEALSIALHTAGTFALGAGIALTGQIYHLSEHWPAAILLWAIGASAAWLLLRQWPQAALAAILIPCWACNEWLYRMTADGVSFEEPVAVGLCMLSLAYLTGLRSSSDGPLRKALAWMGGLALLPSAFSIAAMSWDKLPGWQMQWVGWSIALAAPILAALWLRGPAAVWNVAASFWALAMALGNGGHPGRLIEYVWGVAGAIGLIAWGVSEQRAERINLGVAGFALTVLTFYFSDVMDKLDRSLSLIVLGALFLGGGWLLERTRRHLVESIRPEAI